MQVPVGDALLGQRRISQQQQLSHLSFPIEWITIDESLAVVLDGLDDLEESTLMKDAFVALTIGSDPNVVMARVADVIGVVGKQRLLLEEYINPTQLPVRSSKPKQTQSLQWTSFLKELKKKCGSNGHHNKKKKTLLHAVIMARGITAEPNSIQLRVRLAQEEALRNARAFEEGRPLDLVVAQIQAAIVEAEKAGESVSLDQIAELFPKDQELQVVDVNHVPQRKPAEATILVVNGARVRRELVGQKETIRISKELLDNAMNFHTGAGFGLDRPSLLDQDVAWTLTAYGHEKALTTHDKRAVRTMSVSKDYRFYNLELEHNLEARVPLTEHDSFLVAISGHKAALYDATPELDELDAVGEAREWPMAPELAKDLYGRALAIRSDRYEFFEPESNDDPTQWLRITEQVGSEALSRFEKGQRHLLSVGNTQAVFRVDSVIIDRVEERAIVVFGYEGGRYWDLEQVPYDVRPKEEITMKRLSEASPKQFEAIELTIEKAIQNEQDLLADVDVDAAADEYGDGADDPEQANLEEITDSIKELLEDEPDRDVLLSEVASWIEEKELPEIKVTGVEYVAQRGAYETLSSVSGGLGIEARESKNGNYVLIDIAPENIETVKSIQHKSRLVDNAPESEVTEKLLVTHLEETREFVLGVEPDGWVGYVSIYSGGKGGYGVCDNEKIWKVLRKKKDGKCIYRMVVKKGARANRIAYGKHRKCVMYIDQYTSVDSMPAD
jgi:hypothetical protein